MSKLHNKQLLFPLSGSFTGSLLGSASYALTASYAMNAGTTIDTGSFATTGSNRFNGNQTITGSLIQGLAGNIATGEYSHAEGSTTKAIGDYSHAEGDNTQAKGNYSHAEGLETIASGSYSHAEGYQTIASANYQHVQGQWNATSSVESAFIIGNGTDDSNRSNLVFAAGNTFQVTGSLNVSAGITGSLFGTASYALNVNVFPFSGSADITGSMYVVGPTNIVSIPTYQSTDFFLVRNAVTTFKVSTGVEITSSAQIPLQINNETSQSILQISQSGLITFATFSFEQTGTAPNGGIYFTSASMYIGLD